MLSVSVFSQNVMPVHVNNGLVYVCTYTSDMAPVKILVDTGAMTSFCARSSLLVDEVSDMRVLRGMSGETYVVRRGRVDVIGLKFSAYYIELDSYDAILGLDWMLEHKAKIDLERMVLEYY